MNQTISFPTLVAPPIVHTLETARPRPRTCGKFIYAGDDKLLIRGVTYGPFRPDEQGSEYHSPERVACDLRTMAAHQINAVRTYTVPPTWFLDLVAQAGMYVLVGLPWEQHIAFLDDPEHIRSIEARVREGVRSCAGHPALLGFAVGNEIPTSIVRWHGPHRIEGFIERLYTAAKSEDRDALVTYVNYPSTEYLRLPFLDFVSFNVFLESPAPMRGYLSRLQNIAEERPLLLSEIGLDSRHHGEMVQAYTLDWQIKSAFEQGCAGTFVFSWTDEWYRGGQDVLDWDFGLTDRQGRAKPALKAVENAFAAVPFHPDTHWPKISVIVCSYNGSRTIRQCCEGLLRLNYPNYEVIIVDDGSTDQTSAIAGEYGFFVIRTPNKGLSHARNVGMQAARGTILAYIDDDAWPDPDWLTFLAHTFLTTNHAAVGGPNVCPPEDGVVAQCVSRSPGNPVQVLLSDREAEHIPGCNLAIRKERLEAIGGFDPRFRVAGDDVDVCWRLRQRGWTLGYNPAAFVWHHRRNSIRAYLRQQRGYGKAEALLERKWPEKYNAAGHPTWRGRVYDQSQRVSLPWSPQRVYYGTFGSAPFQSVYSPSTGGFWLGSTPEWYLVIAGLVVLSLLGFLSPAFYQFLAPLAFASALVLVQVYAAAAATSLPKSYSSRAARVKPRALIFALYLLQPLARLVGRRWDGLRRGGRDPEGLALPVPRTYSFWHEQWLSAQDWLARIESRLRLSESAVMRGGNFDRWDLEVRPGLWSSVRLLLAIEEHEKGHQLVRVHADPRWSVSGRGAVFLFEVFAAVGVLTSQPPLSILMSVVTGVLVIVSILECARGMAVVHLALEKATPRRGKATLQRVESRNK